MTRKPLFLAALATLSACSTLYSEETPNTPPGPTPAIDASTDGGVDADADTSAPVADSAVEDGSCAKATTPGCACGVVCASKTCSNGGCDPLVFVTSATWPGDLGASAGPATNALTRADGFCMEAAAKLSRTPITQFYAWLSNTSGSPVARFTRTKRSYRKTNGEVVASDFDELVSPRSRIDRTETNLLLPNEHVWTGTTPSGTPFQDRCNDWTNKTTGTFGGAGLTGGTGPLWTLEGSVDCSTQMHLYCFEQLP